MTNTDCTVLVCSCDKYADLLAPFATLWRKYWPDCPFETVLVTETAPDGKLCFNRVVACGKGGNWCGRLVVALEAIATPYVIMLCDDYYLSSPVDTAGILLRLGQAKNYDAANLRLIPNPVPGVRNSSPAEGGLFEYHKNTAYCIATQAGIWNREFLQSLAKGRRASGSSSATAVLQLATRSGRCLSRRPRSSRLSMPSTKDIGRSSA